MHQDQSCWLEFTSLWQCFWRLQTKRVSVLVSMKMIFRLMMPKKGREISIFVWTPIRMTRQFVVIGRTLFLCGDDDGETCSPSVATSPSWILTVTALLLLLLWQNCILSIFNLEKHHKTKNNVGRKNNWSPSCCSSRRRWRSEFQIVLDGRQMRALMLSILLSNCNAFPISYSLLFFKLPTNQKHSKNCPRTNWKS